jgi:sugar phosphate isomerase/epimerase
MTAIPVALQLFTVRDEIARDFVGTLHRVAQIGYTAVELSDSGGLPVEAMKAALAETGLQVVGTHVELDVVEAHLDREIAYCVGIGCPYLVLSWLEPRQRSVDNLPALASRLNAYGRRCQEQGMAFGYHNHDFEFARSNGTAMLDALLETTDAAFVTFELDVYWTAYAGVIPEDYIRQHAGRIALLHLKDMTAERTFADVGAGILDMPAICAAAEESGVRWHIVEHDEPTIPSLDSASRSLAHLRAMGKA